MKFTIRDFSPSRPINKSRLVSRHEKYNFFNLFETNNNSRTHRRPELRGEGKTENLPPTPLDFEYNFEKFFSFVTLYFLIKQSLL